MPGRDGEAAARGRLEQVTNPAPSASPSVSPAAPPHPLDELVDDLGGWLTVPEVADRLGLPANRARQLLGERQLLAVRRGENNALYVPAVFVQGDRVLKGLPGAITVLADAGYDDLAALRWLFTPDPSLPGAPAQALGENRGTEVKRRAQALAL